MGFRLTHLGETCRKTLEMGASASGCFQLVCLLLTGRAPTRATSSSRPGASVPRGVALSSMVSPMRFSFSCASLAASTSPKVFIACIPVDFATQTARHCARKAIGDRKSVDVTSNPTAFLGQAHSFVGNVLKSVWSHKHGATKHQQSRQVPVRTKPELQEGQRKSQRTRRCSKQW